MTKPAKSLAQPRAERASASSVLHSSIETASGRAQSTPAGPATASFSPGSDPVRSAIPVKLVWHDPVTGEELTVQLEACAELIDGLKEEGFEPSSPEGGAEGGAEGDSDGNSGGEKGSSAGDTAAA